MFLGIFLSATFRPKTTDTPYNGHAVNFTLVWKDGLITDGSAKVEMLQGKTVTVSSMQEVIGGATYTQ